MKHFGYSMKKWITLSIFCLCHFGYAAPIQDRRIEPSALSELTIALGIPETSDIIEETQKRWLRKPTQEKWEMGELSSDERLFVLNWSKQHGLFSEWKPSSETYDKALILGANTRLMEKRLDHLVQIWNEGTRFDEIVWLTGDRPLDRRIDDLMERCENESEAAHIIWDEADLPESMRQLPVVFVAVPMKNEEGQLKRPNTEDTIIAWLEICQNPCKALFVTDQPFCGYQFAVIKSNLPDAFLFDVVGRGADPSSHPAAAAITLDSIARWIYQDSLTK